MLQSHQALVGSFPANSGMWQVWQATAFTCVSTRASVCLCPSWQSVQATPFESSTLTEKALPWIW